MYFCFQKHLFHSGTWARVRIYPPPPVWGSSPSLPGSGFFCIAVTSLLGISAVVGVLTTPTKEESLSYEVFAFPNWSKD